MYGYESILIIYNPTSTSGKARAKAVRLTRQLKRRGFQNVKLRKTDYPGHAEELAFNEAINYKKPLLVSVSGDGGYHEIINGALRAQIKNSHAHPVCAILAAGNANDHSRATAKQPLLRSIINNNPEPIDILEIKYASKSRFAHSYIGIGVTADTVARLNEHQLSRIKEVKIVTKSLFQFSHFSIRTGDKQRKVDSIVFASIHRMSKVLKIGDKSNFNNGKFRIVIIPHRTRFKFFYLLIKIVIFGVKNPEQLSHYSFQLQKPQLCQLDGEPLALPPNTLITVISRPTLLSVIR